MALALVLVGCSAAPATTPSTRRPATATASATPQPTTTPAAQSPAPIVTALAEQFADQTASGAWDAQWNELAPEAQALWPSQGDRTAMLEAKFSGAPIASVSLGPPTAGVTWYDPESPAVSVSDTWRFPVRVSFASPASLSPPGVAALYSMTQISVEYDLTTGAAWVVGEARVDGRAGARPPAGVTARQLDVPIFMYHLVENQEPQESAYGGNTYGWRIDVGLDHPHQPVPGPRWALRTLDRRHQHLAAPPGRRPPPLRAAAAGPFLRGDLRRRLGSSQWTNAVPILRQYGFTAVFFPARPWSAASNGPQAVRATAAEPCGTGRTPASPLATYTLRTTWRFLGSDTATAQQLESGRCAT